MTAEDRLTIVERHVADCQRWEAEHDGRINAYWEQQFRWNARYEKWMESLEKRVDGLERRVMYIAGIASALGAGIGAYLGG